MSQVVKQMIGGITQSKVRGKAFVEELNRTLSPQAIASYSVSKKKNDKKK